MRKFFLFTVLSFMLLTSCEKANAEINKEFDQLEGKITISSERSVVISPSTTLKAIASKSFLGDDGFKDSRVTTIVFEIIEPMIDRSTSNRIFWMAEGEPFGHEEEFTISPLGPIRTLIVSDKLKKQILAEKTLIIKIPMSIGNPILFKTSPDTLKEWSTVITFDAIKNPPSQSK